MKKKDDNVKSLYEKRREKKGYKKEESETPEEFARRIGLEKTDIMYEFFVDSSSEIDEEVEEVDVDKVGLIIGFGALAFIVIIIFINILI